MRVIIFFACMMFASFSSRAQARPELFWVVETNKYERDYSIVKIYDTEQNLVHETRLNKRINIAKKRDRQQIEKVVNRYTLWYAVSRKNTKLKS